MRLLLTALLVLPVISYSQVQVKNTSTSGEKENIVGIAKNLDVMVSKLTYGIVGADTAYTLTLIKGKNTFIADYQLLLFIGAGSLNKFYTAVKSVFSEDNKKDKDYKVEMDVNGTKVTISTSRIKNNMAVLITTEEGDCSLTEKQVVQTFGR
jgi:hypothetical protein